MLPKHDRAEILRMLLESPPSSLHGENPSGRWSEFLAERHPILTGMQSS